ncbi:hypothetical protein HZH68_015567 [Vespula germanica]|uniref:Uncharacterized protein n=1 Tax=Vespula germanica TaxID=30212 RepID=A0A834MS62_VESGE|nr:hypothetical protein HZH68_015567 [Vespula germanica]
MIQKMNSFIHIGMCAVYAYITIHASFLQSIPLLEELFSEFDPGILKFLTMWNVVSGKIFFRVIRDFFFSRISQS